ANAVELMQRLGLADPHLRQMRGIIERQVEHLTRLVDDLLDVSRITQGKIILRKEKIDLANVVSRAIETSGPFIEARRQNLTISLPVNPVPIEGDLTRLAQVVSNLLDNAAKYNEEGGHIWLTAECTDGKLAVRIKDDGMGIGPDTLPHVFDLFAQADRS